MGANDNRPASRKLGSYEVLGEIGHGGMGIVYLARQPSLERFVVLKKIRRDLLGDASLVDRFRLEARAAAAIHHQNVVAVHDCFSHRGDLYISQELVDGKNLEAISESLGRIDPSVVAIIALEVARGLEEIHANGIVHRDLKPANILIGRGGEIKIADFGIAFAAGQGGLTRPGTMLGSLPYMSPEQMLGRAVDPRSDLFSFGVLLYELLAGAPPFESPTGDDLQPLVDAMRNESYLPLRKHGVAAPGHLERLIRSCLRFNPAKRARSASEIRQSLDRRNGRTAPDQCRRTVATHFNQKRVLKPRQAQATAVTPRPTGIRGRLGYLPRAAMIMGVLIAGSMIYFQLGAGGSASRPSDALPEAPAAIQPPAEPARLRVAAYPWARIQLEDGSTFHTPRAEPLTIPPGSYLVVFDHPSFGRAEYTVDLDAGEQRLLRHVFEEAETR